MEASVMYPITSASDANRLARAGFCVALVLALCPRPIRAEFEDKTDQWFGEGSVGSSTASFGDFNDGGFVDLATDGGGQKFKAGGLCGTIIWGDINNDGHLDYAAVHGPGGHFLGDGKGGFAAGINKGNDNHWLKIRLQGDSKQVNSCAIGARVRIKLGDKTLTRQVEGGGVGQGNQNDLTLHFGLGEHATEVRHTVTWTNGQTQTGITDVDRMIRVEMR
tara:strand:- start:413 stop:1072 length:660 start_codon:yes stop_codon:yes gene_type:complete